jgi:hypothetical protein
VDLTVSPHLGRLGFVRVLTMAVYRVSDASVAGQASGRAAVGDDAPLLELVGPLVQTAFAATGLLGGTRPPPQGVQAPQGSGAWPWVAVGAVVGVGALLGDAGGITHAGALLALQDGEAGKMTREDAPGWECARPFMSRRPGSPMPAASSCRRRSSRSDGCSMNETWTRTALLLTLLAAACGPDGPHPCFEDEQCEDRETCAAASEDQAGACVLAAGLLDGGERDDAGTGRDGGVDTADGGLGASDAGFVDAGPTGAFTVSTGGGFACALGHDGKVYCWGSNSNGQLGHTSTAVNTFYPPQPVAGLVDATLLAAGENHACVRARANADALSEIFCWGDNASAQLGVTAGGVAGLFALVPLPPGVAEGARSLQAAAATTCLLTSDGEVYCWGPGISGYTANNPVQVAPFSGSSTLHHSNGGTCVRMQQGGIRCLSGVTLGSTVCGGEAGGYRECDLLAGATKLRFNGSNMCQLADTASLLACAGDNTYGVVVPQVPSAGDLTLTQQDPDYSPSDLVLGDQHACMLGLDQIVRCWGRNLYRATGQAAAFGGPCANAATGCHGHLPVPGLPAVTVLSTRRSYNCAVDHEGAVWCWGLLTGNAGTGPTRTVIPTQ